MQDDSTFEGLGELLDGLERRDVAPQWHSEVAWFRLAEQLQKGKRRILPVWIYPVAAAVFAVCLLLLMPPIREQQQPVVHMAEPASLQPEVKAAVIVEEPIKSFVKHSTAAPKPVPPITNAVHVAASIRPQVVTATVQENQAVPPDTQPYLVKREPEVIYTLSEIMTDLPEREAPPKRYSGIFRARPTRDIPQDNNSRKAIQPAAPEVPSIIIN